jgi:hypothetical protein
MCAGMLSQSTDQFSPPLFRLFHAEGIPRGEKRSVDFVRIAEAIVRASQWGHLLSLRSFDRTIGRLVDRCVSIERSPTCAYVYISLHTSTLAGCTRFERMMKKTTVTTATTERKKEKMNRIESRLTNNSDEQREETLLIRTSRTMIMTRVKYKRKMCSLPAGMNGRLSFHSVHILGRMSIMMLAFRRVQCRSKVSSLSLDFLLLLFY